MVSVPKVALSKIHAPVSKEEDTIRNFMSRVHSTSVRARQVATHYRMAVTSKVAEGLNGIKAVGINSVHLVVAQVDKTAGAVKRTSAGAADRLGILGGLVTDATTRAGVFVSVQARRSSKAVGDRFAKAFALGHRVQKALGSKAFNVKTKAADRASRLAKSAVARVPTPVKDRAVVALKFSQAKSQTIKLKATEVRNGLCSKASAINTATLQVLAKPSTKVTAAYAAGGAAVCGAAGGAVGMTTGASFGVAVGVVAAPFTLGLSIPTFATIGAGGGLCTGAALGGAAGVVSGGTVGYGAYSKREEIRFAAVTAQTKASLGADYAVERYGASKAFLTKTLQASYMRLKGKTA